MKQRARLVVFLGVMFGLTGAPGPARTHRRPALPRRPRRRRRPSGSTSSTSRWTPWSPIATASSFATSNRTTSRSSRTASRRPISAFSIVDIPVERLQRPLFAPAPIEPDVKSNERPFDGRIYVMVIDDLHTYFGRTARVRSAARQFIQQHLGANDLMAVVHTAGPSDASQEFTEQQAVAACGRRSDSGPQARLGDRDANGRVLQAARSRAGNGRRGERSGGGRAPLQRAHDADGAQERGRLVFDRARSPEDDSIPQRGHRLRHHAISPTPARR